MKLALVAMTFSQNSLAGGYRALKLVKYLDRAGCEMYLISSDMPEEISTLMKKNMITIPYRIPIRSNLLVGRMINRLLLYPEPDHAWVKPVLTSVLPILRVHRPDAVIVSSPPHSIQMIGVELARELNIPYFADLRDDWLTNHKLRYYTPIHKYVAKKCEEKMVRLSSGIFLNTSIVRERFAKRYPEWPDKLYTITNGYDEEDFADIGGSSTKWMPNNGKMILMYAGGGYGGFITRQLGTLATRMEEIGLDKTWRIVTAGPDEWPPAKFQNIWSHLGLLPHKPVSQAMLNANLLLLPMFPGEKTSSGTVLLKTYGYLRTGSGIVYIGEKGSTTDLLSRFEGTFLLNRQEWPFVADWIADNSSFFKRKHKRTGIEQYSLEHLTKRLLDIIKRELP